MDLSDSIFLPNGKDAMTMKLNVALALVKKKTFASEDGNLGLYKEGRVPSPSNPQITG